MLDLFNVVEGSEIEKGVRPTLEGLARAVTLEVFLEVIRTTWERNMFITDEEIVQRIWSVKALLQVLYPNPSSQMMTPMT